MTRPSPTALPYELRTVEAVEREQGRCVTCRYRRICIELMIDAPGWSGSACSAAVPIAPDLRREEAPALAVLAHIVTAPMAELQRLGVSIAVQQPPRDRRRGLASQGGNEAGQETAPQIEACGHVESAA